MVNKLSRLLVNSYSPLVDKPKLVNNPDSLVYNFNKQNNVRIGPTWKKNVSLLLTTYFKTFYCLISKPVFRITPNGVVIHLMYYKPISSITKLRSLWIKITTPEHRWDVERHKQRLPKVRTDLKNVLDRSLNFNKNIQNIDQRDIRVDHDTFYRNMNSWRGRLLNLPENRLNYITLLLSKLLKTNVELELVRLESPYNDSSILAQLIGINGKRLAYSRIRHAFLKTPILYRLKGIEKKEAIKELNNQVSDIELGSLDHTNAMGRDLVSRLTGIKLRVSGRLARQRVVPKRTVKTAYVGPTCRSQLDIIDSSRFTGKNRRGAFSISVWASHGIRYRNDYNLRK